MSERKNPWAEVYEQNMTHLSKELAKGRFHFCLTCGRISPDQHPTPCPLSRVEGWITTVNDEKVRRMNLLDMLRAKLAYREYDALNLHSLCRLRIEVLNEIEKLKREREHLQ